MTTGIICEYNPMHRGHEEMIKKLRAGGTDTVVCLMSGSFVQRGEPAIADKYGRAAAAVRSGADVVLELPFPWSCGSARYFAAAGIYILNALGVKNIAFGSECADADMLRAAAEAAPEDIRTDTAATGAAAGYFAALNERLGGASRLMPNDILGVEYMRAARVLGTGTDFTVGMIPEAHFCGGSERSLQGIVFNPNIPSEECFISPKRGEAEGIVYATKPLSYQGQLIDKFWIRFHAGKAVEWHAEQNNDLLTKLITMDEGSAYLGECALVPYDSPIRQSGLLFYNTLFDENAACHLALGMGFADTINDFESKTLEECRAMGINDSMVHEDFMIGSEDMDIDAVCENGDVVPVFRHGNWAF